MLTQQNRIVRDAKPVAYTEPQENDLYQEDDEYSDPDIYSSDEESASDTLLEADMKNLNNPMRAPKYAQIIISEAVNEEFQSDLSLHLFTTRQSEITPRMREIAIRWMIKVHMSLGWTSDTLYNAVLFVDISMCRRPIQKVDLQLWLLTCLWVSAKVEEVYALDTSILLDAVDNCFAVEDLVKCERELLMALNFRVSYPTVKLFLRRLLDCTDACDRVCEAAYFICEASLLDARLLDFGFNVIAASCVSVAFRGLGVPCPITHILSYGEIEDEEEMRKCGYILLEKVISILANPQDDLLVRYSHPALQGAALALDLKEPFDVTKSGLLMC